MTADAEPAAPRPQLEAPSLPARLLGLGSVFGKTIRDSRLAFVIASLYAAGLMLIAGIATAEAFGTEATRQQALAMANALGPIVTGLYGGPLDNMTLGGFISWRYGGILMPMIAVWSILAMSSTLVAEARKGSLEFVVATPIPRFRVALEKLLGHVMMLALTMVVVALSLVLTGRLFGTLPGDEIPIEAAVGYAALLGLTCLAAGGLAFALAPMLGRGAAAGIAAAVMFTMYVINGYRDAVPVLENLAPLSWYAWAREHRPLAGLFDWPSLVPIAIVAVALFGIGLVLFGRRDLGSTVPIRLPGIPAALMGIRGPVGRSFAERLPAAFWWGIGIGAFAALMTAAGPSIADALAKSPGIMDIVAVIFPGIDIGSPGGILALMFIELGVIFFGLAGAMLAGGWASDESSGRLEMVLAAPLRRFWWVVRSGLGVFAAILVTAAIVGLMTFAGSAKAGGDAVTPAVGMLALGVFGAAIVGIGFAVGGLLGPGLAAPLTAAYVIVAFLLQILVPALKLPDWMAGLSLGTHLGQPTVGDVDWIGMGACLAIAVVGLALGAWGMARRDLAR